MGHITMLADSPVTPHRLPPHARAIVMRKAPRLARRRLARLGLAAVVLLLAGPAGLQTASAEAIGPAPVVAASAGGGWQAGLLVESGCVRGHGYWKNHAGAWPVDRLTLGQHQYSQQELLALLGRPTKGDASLILSLQLIAARLNVLSGASPVPIAAALDRADGLFGAFATRLPFGTGTNTPVGTDMVTTAAILDAYNNGKLPGSCAAVNTPPLANAGPDQSAALGAIVTLDGSASGDPDGNPVTFQWSMTLRPPDSTAALSASTAVMPTFTADVPGSYQIELIVSDGIADSAPDIVRVSTINSRPTAHAGPDQSLPVGAAAQLDGGASSDPDGDALTYAWSFVSLPAGSQAALSNAVAVNPSFVIDLPGEYTLQLVSSDGTLDSLPDLVTISTVNSAPVADAGPDTTALTGEQVTLDGSSSHDVDGDSLTFTWSFVTRPAGSAAALSDAVSATPAFTIDVFGTYVVQLVVNDGTVNSAAETVVVTTINSRPIAHAGPDREVTAGEAVPLDGSGSTDIDGNPLTYRWALIALPDGSAAALTAPEGVLTSFTADLPGRYVAQLIVNDGLLDSDPDTVAITTIVPPNRAPTADAGPNQTVPLGSVVQLNAEASSDPDSDLLTFRWSLTPPADSTATLSASGVPDPTFVADRRGTYVAQLIVNDGEIDSAPDSASISTENSMPVADAGADRTVAIGATVMLDGGGSSDADGDTLEYVWSLLSKPAGSAALLSDAAAVAPTFIADFEGTYVAQLVVGDGTLVSAPDTVSITAAPGADLVISFFAAASNPPVGSNTAWGVSVHNQGPATTTNVRVRAAFPAGYTFTSKNFGTGSYDEATGIWTIGPMLSGAGANLSISGTVNVTGPYDLTASIIESSAPDPNLANNTRTDVVTPDGNADLALSFFTAASNPPIGSNPAWGISVHNQGPATTTNVRVRAAFPAGYTFTSRNFGTGSYDAATGIWTIGPMLSGAGANLSISGTVNVTGPYDLTASIIESSAPDPNLANNTRTDVVTPNPNADLRMELFTGTSGTVAVGSSIGWVIDVRNLGPAATTDVMVHIPVNGGYTLTSVTLHAGGPYDPATGLWNVGPLVSGGLGRLLLSARIEATGSTTFVPMVTNSAQPDPDPLNNSIAAPPINRPPTANAGVDQAVETLAAVQLDGTASFDADGDPITFEWVFALRPINSAATLADATTSAPSFTPDLPGTYVAQLILRDSLGVASAADSSTVSAIVTNQPPAIVSAPVTSAAVGQGYQYDVNAVDLETSDLLTFSLITAPVGMTIDAVSGIIGWTPAADQAGQQSIVVRVQDAAGLTAAQAYSVQVSSPGNGAPRATDDDYSVRVTESLSIGAPGVTANDIDESPLTASLVTPPGNGMALLNADGSFTYTPHTLQPGEFVLAENVNLAARMPGVTVSGGNCPRCAIDENLSTTWDSSGNAIEVVFPAAVAVSQVTIVATRNQNDHKISAGVFELIDANGAALYDSGPVEILGPSFGATLNVPNLQAVRRVRFTPTASPTFLFASSLAEVKVIGSALIRRERFVEPNLVQLLAATVQSNSVVGGNTAEGLIDDSPRNWYSHGNAGDFIEVTFPMDVALSEFHTANPNGRPDGFNTSLGIDCTGTFVFLDANRTVLFDSGVVNEPSGFPSASDTFTLSIPPLTGLRHVRYTLSGCTGSLPAGFAEWRVIGTADLATPAFALGEKFQALNGREAHSTPIVANLTDDNGDGAINEDDIADIVVAVEAIGDQLKGEIKVISGDDGRELFTAGDPNLVSPWSDLAAGDIDGDGTPDIIAVHSDGNHLIAFEHTGVVKWISDAHAMPSFNLGSVVYTGAISIANLDGAGAPEIIVGASVFDANGRLIGDGRTLNGTTGGVGLRSAISAVADIDLDGTSELIAGPTTYRLNGGALTKVWQRTDRPDGYVAIANLDDDPYAEVISVANGVVYVLNHDGSDYEGWNAPSHAPMAIPGGGQGGAPLVVDVDGDGRPEIGVAAASRFVLFDRDGSVRWSGAISDRTSNSTGAIAFDLNGDGQVEIIYRDEFFLRIYQGADGVLLAKTPVGSATWAEEPVVVDVDNDGHADIVVASDFFQQSQGDTGIIVFQDVANKWKRTRRIWNQHSYHVTNVNEDGSIPVEESAHWLVPGLNSFRTNAFVPGESTDETDSFTYVVSDGVLQSNVATVRIALRTPNTAPAITSAPLINAAVDVAYAYAVAATDSDAGDILAFSLPTAPIGMTIDASSGLLAWTPTNAQSGPHDVIVKVSDVRGLNALQGYSIQVGAPITVPDLVGQVEDAAKSALTAAGLGVGSVSTRHSAAVAQGAVISQNPAGGSSAGAGALVSFVVSLGPPPVGIVPDVVGHTQPSAELEVSAAGFSPGVTGQNNSAVPAGIVFAQAPAAGTIAPENSTVALVVSLGPPPDDLDLDGDGFTGKQGDCNDTNAAINPAAPDPAGDGIDQNCNGVDSIISDNTPPTATIVTPTDLAEITMPTEIIGTATDANFLRYTLTLAEVDATTAETIGSGTSSVANGVLGRIDPTLLENGLYRVRLIVEDVNGQRTVDDRVYRIDGLAKVGNFRISFVDLSVPVASIPISVMRTYDSRVKSREDFGIGWTLDIARGIYRHNRTPGRGWIIRDQPFLGEFLPCIGGTLETLSHLTEVRLSDRESYRFALEITNGNVGITGACEGTASFRFVDGTRPGATLEILDGSAVIYLRGGDDTVLDMNAFLEGTNRVYDPQRVRLTTVDGTRIDLVRRAGIARIEDLNGNALSIRADGIVHSTGKSISFTRDAQNRITRITDPIGNQLEYTYDGNGDLVQFLDAVGNRTSLIYDSSHNLLEVVDPLGNRAGRSEYDAEGRLVAIIDASGNRYAMAHDLSARREELTDRLGGVTVIDYDERGNVLQQTNQLGQTTQFTYDPNDNVLTETDPLGNTRSYTYDAKSNKLTDTDPLGKTTTYTYNALSQQLTRTDPRGGVTTNTYDVKGNRLSETDPEGAVTRYSYDARGQLVRITDAVGAVRRFVYDESGREISATDPLGNTIHRTYDANGRLSTETSARIADGTVQTLTTRYSFDARGLLVSVSDPDNSTTTTSYSTTGRRTGTTDRLGRLTRYIYDEQGRQTRVEKPDGTSDQYEYDAEGRRTTTIDAAGRQVSQTYDAAGRVVATRNADATTRTASYDASGGMISRTDENGRAISIGYDPAGRTISTTDALGVVELSTYDASGNLASHRDRNGNTTTFTYDLASRLTRTTYSDGTSVSQVYDQLGRLITRVDQEGNPTRYEYNLRGDLVAVVDAMENRTTYDYDAVGNRVALNDAAGRSTRYTYDRARRLVTTSLPLGQTTNHRYDAAGNVISTLDFNGDLTLFGYDLQNRLTQRTMPAAEGHGFTYTPTGRIATMTDSRGTTTFEYDLQDRPTVARQPDGREIRYAYDNVGNRTAVTTPAGTTRFTYDGANRMTAVEDAAGNRIALGYDPAGKPTLIEYPGGLTSSFSYDSLNRLTELTHRKDGATVASYAYTLGSRGQRLQVSEHSGRQVDYAYDTLGRLVREATSNGASTIAIDYTYDAVGNRLTRAGPAGLLSYTYDGNHRLTGAGPMVFAYDANGNQTARTVSGASTTYGYDALGRLRQVTSPTGAVTRYIYDALNQRVQRATPAGTTNFLVDPAHPSGLSQVLLESDEAGQIGAAYAHAGAVPISQNRGGETTFGLTDGHSSTRLLADTTGAVTDTFDYDAFGTLLSKTGTTPSAYQFNGQEFDAASGLYHLRAREYDPTIGRFTSVDPFPGFQNNPVTLHPYLYAQNDPANLSDPSGEVTLMEAMFVANAVFTVATTAYDLHQGNYKSAAINLGLGVVPFGSLFKAVFRGARTVPRIFNLAADAPTATGITNLASDAVTEIAHLAPEVATETAIVIENLGNAIATLPEAATAVSQAAMKIDRSSEALYLLTSQGEEISRAYHSLRLLYLQGANASDLARHMRRWVGQPGWEARLCAIGRAHRFFTTQLSQNSTFGTSVVVAVNMTLRGSGSRCLGDS